MKKEQQNYICLTIMKKKQKVSFFLTKISAFSISHFERAYLQYLLYMMHTFWVTTARPFSHL
jgi:hypothetical protein